MLSAVNYTLNHNRVLSLLQSCDCWVKSTRMGKNINNGYLMLGMRRHVQTPGVGLKTSTNRELVERIIKLVRHAKPGFKFSSLYINKNFSGALHYDKGNDGDSLMFTLGNFTGCDLWIYPGERLRTKDKWIQFDGKRPHCTYDYVGDRYSIIIFTHSSFEWATDAHKRELLSYGFPLPHKFIRQSNVCTLREASKLLPSELNHRVVDASHQDSYSN